MDDEALKRVQEQDRKRIAENGGVAEMIQVTERGTRVVLVQAEGPTDPAASEAAIVADEAAYEKEEGAKTESS